MRKAITCPVCGREMRKGDTRAGGFRCPNCKEQLRLDTSYVRPICVGSLLLAIMISYLVGMRGIALFFGTFFLWIPLYIVGIIITYYFYRRLVKYTPKYGDVDFRLTGPPGSSSKP